MTQKIVDCSLDYEGDVPDVLIKGARLVSAGCGVTEEKNVFLRQGRIEWIQSLAGESAPGAIQVDASGAVLSPGFIDLHIHGTGMHLVDEGREALESLSALLPCYGVTGFLPTVLPDVKAAHIRLFEELSESRPEGSQILGFFAEGPFLSVPGSLSIDPDQGVDIDWVSSIQQAAKPYSVVFAISPEFPRLSELFSQMTSQSFPMFITHTCAGVQETLDAIRHGGKHATHFYDVFPVPLEKEAGVRPCGAVEAILSDPTVSVDFILDGEHVDPIAVKMAIASKGVEKVCLITDANRGAGMSPGKWFQFGKHTVSFAHEGAPARLSDEHPECPGALAGSGLTMDCAVRNAVKLLGVSLEEAITMATLAPAKVLGLEGHKGRIEEGYDADLVLLDPDTLKPKRTWVGGRDVFNEPNCRTI